MAFAESRAVSTSSCSLRALAAAISPPGGPQRAASCPFMNSLRLSPHPPTPHLYSAPVLLPRYILILPRCTIILPGCTSILHRCASILPRCPSILASCLLIRSDALLSGPDALLFGPDALLFCLDAYFAPFYKYFAKMTPAPPLGFSEAFSQSSLPPYIPPLTWSCPPTRPRIHVARRARVRPQAGPQPSYQVSTCAAAGVARRSRPPLELGVHPSRASG